ncbi:MAG: hypothetical protein M3458_05655 [Acidobacteriota bacterium]|nr:hypothetical protein [Acidobacteriota bacterium]
MEDKVFWDLLEDACEMGKFIVAVPNSAASANIVGKIELGRDGNERVLQKRNRPNYHVHFKLEMISEFAFVHLDTGHGLEPCLEVRSTEGQPVLRLYYKGKRATGRYDKFMGKNSEHAAFVNGSWARPNDTQGGEVPNGDAAPTEIFVAPHASDDEEEMHIS